MKIVFTDLDHADHDVETEIFKRAGFDVPLLECQSEEALIEQLQGVDIALNQYAPFTRRVLEALPDLKQIVRYGVGVNNVDLEAANAAGVQVCNVPDYGMHEVSDHALALSLALIRKLVPMNAGCQAGRWEYADAMPIRRQTRMTAGVVGLGRIGRLYARKMAALGFNVIAHDRYHQPNAEDGTDQLHCLELDDLFGEADVIGLFCPLTEETRHLVDASALARMKDSAYLINTSRGGIIDEAALAQALKESRLAGAALDTTEQEPLPADSPLRGIDNCLITPHMAWYSEDAAQELKRKVAEEAVRFAKGEQVLWPVNRQPR